MLCMIINTHMKKIYDGVINTLNWQSDNHCKNNVGALWVITGACITGVTQKIDPN